MFDCPRRENSVQILNIKGFIRYESNNKVNEYEKYEIYNEIPNKKYDLL